MTTVGLAGIAAVGALAAAALATHLWMLVTIASVRLRQASAAALPPAADRLPVSLVLGGAPCMDALRRERITLAELHAVLRRHGLERLEDAVAVVLEPDGAFSVFVRRDDRGHWAFHRVPEARPPPR